MMYSPGPVEDRTPDIEGLEEKVGELERLVAAHPLAFAPLIGKAPDRKVFETAARLAIEGARPLSGNHYKLELLPRTIVRALEIAVEAA